MSMYPDESIKDSPSEKRRKIYARLFWVFIFSTLLLAAAALYVNFNGVSVKSNDSPIGITSTAIPSASPSISAVSSAIVDNCNAVVETMPGDLEIVLSWGWEIKCFEEGADPDLGESGKEDDLYTFGYADPQTKLIAIDAPEVTAETIAHEAAHVIDYEQLVLADKDAIAAKYGATDWNDESDYFNRPSEMFAEARMRCLGYEHDPDFGLMSCEDVERLIAGTEQADDINRLAKLSS